MGKLTATEKLVLQHIQLAKDNGEKITRYDLEAEAGIPIDTLKKLLPRLRRAGLITEIRRGELNLPIT
jgi:DNA-binding IscR family transcriptional regulator